MHNISHRLAPTRHQRVLREKFFGRPTLVVAREMLGKILVRNTGHEIIEGIITEVEAYIGPEDKASHASRGRTPRAEIMFGKPGVWYVYLIYGMYCCLNIVTEAEGYPAAILIRSVQGVTGPGRLCKRFRIDRTLNKKPAAKTTGLWIEDRGIAISPQSIKRGRRIGVDYAGAWKEKPWRFFV